LINTPVIMATKYAFAQGLKELRFHLCQKSEHSAAARWATGVYVEDVQLELTDV
jgi:hypothetical protein